MFAPSVRETKVLAGRIAHACAGLTPAAKIVEELSLVEESESIVALTMTLAHAVAFHNADLTLEERLVVEKGFRGGEIRCIVSTSTLSMGVNLPASTVIITKPVKWTKERGQSWQQVPLAVAEYRNMSGRAGRFGYIKDAVGRSIMIAKTPFEQQSLFNQYARGEPAPLNSVFIKGNLRLALLRCIASGLCNTADGARRFLLKTFAARSEWNNEASRDLLDKNIKETMLVLKAHALIEDQDGGKLSATRVGRVCAASGLQISTFVLLMEAVKRRYTSPVDMALLASSCADTGPDSISISLSTEEYQGRYQVFRGTIVEACDRDPSPQTSAFLESLRGSGLPEYEQVRQMKFLCVASAYLNGVASREIEKHLGISAGRARAVGRQCSWLADTAANIAWSLGCASEAKIYERIAERFLHGCTEAAMILAYIPHSLHRAERERLVASGFDSLQKIVETQPIEIAQQARVNRQRVALLQRRILDVLGPSLDLEKNQCARMTAIGASVKLVEELYAATGTSLEQAIENVLSHPFCPLTVTRFSKQRHAEPDLKIILPSGRVGIVQVTAKDKPTDKVSATKSGSVLQQLPEMNPEVFICVGRPDFDEEAVKSANAHAMNSKNFKLIPVAVLAEMYVRFCEGTLASQRVAEILVRDVGYITVDRI